MQHAIAIAGFRTGFDRIREIVAGVDAQVLWFPEDSQEDPPQNLRCLVLLFEKYTSSSTQLLSLFYYLRDHGAPTHKLLVQLEQVELDDYPHFKDLAVISPAELRDTLTSLLNT